MCGIAGYLKLNEKLDKERFSLNLAEMLDLIKYRGPNDKGIYQDDWISLGNLRLSILDLSSAGHQPMKNSNGSLIITHNGEIYNYLEIREELQKKGYDFKTNTDTEVILAAYQEWGEDCVKRFNGMWAFVIWDKKKKKLFVSRDRFGIKPLFYTQDKNSFIFASEIKSLIPFLKKKEINYPFLYNFIDRQISYGSNQTLFKDIQFLRPAHNLIIDLNNGAKIKKECYWRFLPDRFREKYDYSQPVNTFRELLIDSVKLRLKSDVPVGVCLSGGIDSSVITCIISKILKQKVKTFSSIYKQPGYGEKEFIDEVNQECQTEPTFIYPSADNFFKVLKSLIRHHDKPIRMPGAYSQWHVFECAADKVIVTLDGQGGDELLAGYPYYYPYYLADLIKDLSIIKYLKTQKQIKEHLKKDYYKDTLKILFPWLIKFKALFKEKEHWQDQILTDDFIIKYKSSLIKKEPGVLSSYLNQELYRTFATTNLPMLLDNEDRVSMAFSLESRVPFLDYRLVEFCFGLDYRYKINGYTTKYILRQAFKDILPKKVYQRKDKKGFPTPLEHWFRQELKDDLKKIFTSKEFAKDNILDAQKIQRIFSEHLAGRNHSRILWRALVIHFWLKEYSRFL
jgi:asparagine synthase (glutamine-hydrolysing)